jgi:hypoxanthine phosphoribosyltransferase
MNTNIPQIKCIECKELKPETDFKSWAVKENKQLYCKECRRKISWRIKNNNTVEYRKEYYNKEEVKKRQKIHNKNYWQRLKSNPEKLADFYKKTQEKKKIRWNKHPFKRLSMKLKLRDKNSTVKPIDLWHITKYQKGKCVLTGRKLTNENVSPDHIICLTHGGLTEPKNIRLVVKEVNNARGVLSDADFVKLCKDVVIHHNA